MAAVATFNAVMDATMSWEKAKFMQSYRENAELMFMRFLESEATARQLFKVVAQEDTTKNSRFAVHANAIMDMIDCAVDFSQDGTDLDQLKEELAFIKQEHFAKGVRGKYLAKMESAVLSVAEQILKSKCPRNHRRSWQEQSFFCE